MESHEWSIDAWKKEERDFDLKPTFSTQQEVEPMSKSTAMFHVTVLPKLSAAARFHYEQLEIHLYYAQFSLINKIGWENNE